MKATAELNTSILLLLLILGLAASDALAADATFDLSFSIDEPLVLEVDTGSGSIRVRAGSGDEATVHGKIKVQRRFLWGKPRNADDLIQRVKDAPPIELENGRLQVGHSLDRELRNKLSISYEIVVPGETEVFANTGSGSISVIDVTAPVDVHTGSGSVKLVNIGGSSRAVTGSGSIRAESVAGAFDGRSGSGSIYLEQTAPGDVVVSTGSGSSNLIGVTGSVRASAGSGRIVVSGRQEGDWKLDTGSGSIRASLPADAAFDLDAESSSGDIDVDHPLTVEGRVSRKHLIGTVRGGGPLLQIATGSGSIRVN